MNTITATEAMTRLGISRKELEVLLDNGKLTLVGRSDGRGHARLLDRDEVEEYAATLTTHATMTEIRRWAGLEGRGNTPAWVIRAWNKAHPGRPYAILPTIGEDYAQDPDSVRLKSDRGRANRWNPRPPAQPRAAADAG